MEFTEEKIAKVLYAITIILCFVTIFTGNNDILLATLGTFIAACFVDRDNVIAKFKDANKK